MKVTRGDIIYLNKKGEPFGHVQSNEGKNRPHVVISNEIGNEASGICLITPLTTSHKRLKIPTHTIISHNRSMILCEQIYCINQDDIRDIVGHLSDEEIKRLNACLRVSLEV